MNVERHNCQVDRHAPKVTDLFGYDGFFFIIIHRLYFHSQRPFSRDFSGRICQRLTHPLHLFTKTKSRQAAIYKLPLIIRELTRERLDAGAGGVHHIHLDKSQNQDGCLGRAILPTLSSSVVRVARQGSLPFPSNEFDHFANRSVHSAAS